MSERVAEAVKLAGASNLTMEQGIGCWMVFSKKGRKLLKLELMFKIERLQVDASRPGLHGFRDSTTINKVSLEARGRRTISRYPARLC